MRDQANFWPEVQALLNWGFAADGHVTPVGELVAPLEPTPAPAPSPTQAVQPTVQAVTATAAAPAAQAAPVAKAAVKAASRSTSNGVGISSVLIWSAVGVGALFFVAASWQFARRRHAERDRRPISRRTVPALEPRRPRVKVASAERLFASRQPPAECRLPPAPLPPAPCPCRRPPAE